MLHRLHRLHRLHGCPRSGTCALYSQWLLKNLLLHLLHWRLSCLQSLHRPARKTRSLPNSHHTLRFLRSMRRLLDGKEAAFHSRSTLLDEAVWHRPWQSCCYSSYGLHICLRWHRHCSFRFLDVLRRCKLQKTSWEVCLGLMLFSLAYPCSMALYSRGALTTPRGTAVTKNVVGDALPSRLKKTALVYAALGFTTIGAPFFSLHAGVVPPLSLQTVMGSIVAAASFATGGEVAHWLPKHSRAVA